MRDEMCNDGAPVIVTLAERLVVGRKDYRCSTCREPIPAGTRHAYAAWTEDGEFRTERTHGFGYPSCPQDIDYERRAAEAWAASQNWPVVT